MTGKLCELMTEREIAAASNFIIDTHKIPGATLNQP